MLNTKKKRHRLFNTADTDSICAKHDCFTNIISVQVIPGPNWIPGNQTSVNYHCKWNTHFQIQWDMNYSSSLLLFYQSPYMSFCFNSSWYMFLWTNLNRLLLCLNLQAKTLFFFAEKETSLAKLLTHTVLFWNWVVGVCFDSAFVATESKTSTSEYFFTHSCHHVTPFTGMHL